MIFKPFPENDITQEDRVYIEEIQRMLRALEIEKNGTSNVPIDGIFGPATTAAVKDFQYMQGLPATGIVDRKTYEQLVDAYAAFNLKSLQIVPIFGFQPQKDEVLRLGNIEDAVYFLSIMLKSIAVVFKNIPFPSVGAEYTEQTAKTVRALQHVLGLPVTGVVDRRTWNRITALYNDLVYDLTVERYNAD